MLEQAVPGDDPEKDDDCRTCHCGDGTVYPLVDDEDIRDQEYHDSYEKGDVYH